METNVGHSARNSLADVEVTKLRWIICLTCYGYVHTIQF